MEFAFNRHEPVYDRILFVLTLDRQKMKERILIGEEAQIRFRLQGDVCNGFGRCMLQVFQKLRPVVHNQAALACLPFNPVSHGGLLIHRSFHAV